ncbi:MAG: phosphate ABC transporter permease subunit PstC [Epsilonproteobacteria bacterium]|nr:MAG: phosphate ABC transporter permease subunit PstC [Campylobacterota bacterium]RLA67833.1 MAG: phosphate ABC transporter permease subunit PstC [Campylobacterota bacterium]
MAKSKALGTGIKLYLMACVSLTVVVSGSVIVLLGKESIEFFSQVPFFDFLFGSRWEPLLEPKSFGVLPLLSGTFLIVVGSISIALPFGLLIAIYLSEFASHRFRSIIKPALEILAGIPTVVYGYFALTFVTPILKSIWPETEVFNAASAFIVVGIMILPMVTSLSDDAFRALPSSLKEGAYALGATPLEVSIQVILPAASLRVWAAVILAISRAVGETMAVSIAAGANPKLTLNPLESIQTMTAYIVQVSMGDTPQGGVEYLTCFAVAGLLFVLTWSMNALGSHFIFAKGKN